VKRKLSENFLNATALNGRKVEKFSIESGRIAQIAFKILKLSNFFFVFVAFHSCSTFGSGKFLMQWNWKLERNMQRLIKARCYDELRQ
jgi:hypothetical protein